MKINQYKSDEEQSAILAEKITEKVNAILSQQNKVCIAVSGGKSPIKLFEKLSHKDLDWAKVEITLVDERFIATSHKDSNQHLVVKHLLIHKAASASFTGLVTDNANILDCINNANLNVKAIDIAILGMGEDGHTASIFPCCNELSFVTNTELATAKYVITTPKTANYQRLGLSLNGILAIPNLFISINGRNKLTIIERALQEETPQYPISYVLNRRKDAQIFWHA